MTFLEVVILLVIAGVCGALGQAIAGVSRGGCLVSIVLGFIGAFVGRAIAQWLELPEPFIVSVGDRSFPLMWSIIGAALFVAVIALLTGRRGRS